MATNFGLPTVPRGLDRELTLYLQALDSIVRYLSKAYQNEQDRASALVSKENVNYIAAQVLHDASINTNKLARGAVTTEKISRGAVTTDKLDDECITQDKLKNESVTEEKLDPDLLARITALEEALAELAPPEEGDTQ